MLVFQLHNILYPSFVDIQAMFAGRDYFRGLEGILYKTTERNYFKSRTSRMEYVSDWTKHTKSSAFTSQVICGATFFMPWSLKIPIGDGFHEFL
jgi:hypothetical protein